MIEKTIKDINTLISLIKTYSELNYFNDGVDSDIIYYLEKLKKPLEEFMKGGK